MSHDTNAPVIRQVQHLTILNAQGRGRSNYVPQGKRSGLPLW